jgi:hypothetical protein
MKTEYAGYAGGYPKKRRRVLLASLPQSSICRMKTEYAGYAGGYPKKRRRVLLASLPQSSISQ